MPTLPLTPARRRALTLATREGGTTLAALIYGAPNVSECERALGDLFRAGLVFLPEGDVRRYVATPAGRTLIARAA